MENSLRKIYVFVFATAMLWAIVFFLMPVYLKDIGFSGIEIGLLSGTIAISSIISLFPFGYINDRWSTRGMLIAGFVALAIFFAGLGFLEDFWIFVPLYVLGGMAGNGARNTLRNLVYKNEESTRQGEKYGKYQSFFIYGYLAGLVAIALLFSFVDFPFVLRLSALCFLALAAFSLTLKPTKITMARLSEYRTDFMKKDIVFFALALFLFTMHWGAESTSYGLFVRHGLGLDLTMSSLFMAIPLVFLGLAALRYGKKMDKGLDVKRLFVTGALLSGITHILMAYPLVEWSFIMRCIHEFADGMINVAFLYQTAKFFPRERIGGNASIIATFMAVGEFFGAVLFGWMGAEFGYALPLIVSGAIAVLVAAAYWAYGRKG